MTPLPRRSHLWSSALDWLLVFMSLVMARSFTKPFKDMANSINRISDGFFDEEVNLTGFSEVEQISEAFNTMLTSTAGT